MSLSTRQNVASSIGISYDSGQRGWLGRMARRAHSRMPVSVRAAIWRHVARKVFRRKGYHLTVPLFRSVEMETRTRCNSMCHFCGASVLNDKRPDTYMPEHLHDKILGSLSDLSYDGTVRYYLNNEPLLDHRMPTFIRKCKAAVPRATVELGTNGISLNAEVGRPLLEAGLDVLYINSYSTTQDVRPGVREFIETVVPDYSHCRVALALRRIDAQMMNRGGTSPNGIALTNPMLVPCILPFEEFPITTDGRVSICCQDLYFENVMGDLTRQSMEEIWYSRPFVELRKRLLRGDRRAMSLCRVCDFIGTKPHHWTPTESQAIAVAGRMLNDL